MKPSLHHDLKGDVCSYFFSSLVLLILFICITTPSPAVALQAFLESCSSQNFPFVFLHVRVEEGGVPITNLTAGNFRCSENGVSQTDLFQVTPPQVSAGVRLADVVFLIDVSGSMGEEIAGVRTNVKAFAQALSLSDIDFRLGLVQLVLTR